MITGEERFWSGVLGPCLLAAGAILMGSAVPVARHYFRFFRRSRRVAARVVDHVTAADPSGTHYSAVIEYEMDGQTRRYVDEVSSPRPPRVGERVDVRVGDEHGAAQRGGLVLFFQMIVLPPLLAFMGAGILFGGYYLLRRAWTGQ